MNRFQQPEKTYVVYLSDGSSFRVKAISERKAREIVERKLPNGIEVDSVETDNEPDNNTPYLRD